MRRAHEAPRVHFGAGGRLDRAARAEPTPTHRLSPADSRREQRAATAKASQRSPSRERTRRGSAPEEVQQVIVNATTQKNYRVTILHATKQ